MELNETFKPSHPFFPPALLLSFPPPIPLLLPSFPPSLLPSCPLSPFPSFLLPLPSFPTPLSYPFLLPPSLLPSSPSSSATCLDKYCIALTPAASGQVQLQANWAAATGEKMGWGG